MPMQLKSTVVAGLPFLPLRQRTQSSPGRLGGWDISGVFLLPSGGPSGESNFSIKMENNFSIKICRPGYRKNFWAPALENSLSTNTCQWDFLSADGLGSRFNNDGPMKNSLEPLPVLNGPGKSGRQGSQNNEPWPFAVLELLRFRELFIGFLISNLKICYL